MQLNGIFKQISHRKWMITTNSAPWNLYPLHQCRNPVHLVMWHLFTRQPISRVGANIVFVGYMVRTRHLHICWCLVQASVAYIGHKALHWQGEMMMGFWFCSGFRLTSTKCMMVVDMWRKLQHSNIVQLRELFTTKVFGDNCEWPKAINLFAIFDTFLKTLCCLFQLLSLCMITIQGQKP